jgi:cytochrome c553
MLSETGIFGDPGTRTPASDLVPFAPTHVLWSDGATKRRWVRLPAGTRVDTSEMDHWQFPIGTRFWKEFASPQGVLLETRLIERYGPGPEDYWMGAFVWNAEQTQATFAIDGQSNINGTQHDAPAQKVCGACHRGDKGRVLGFSAIQLSRPGDGTTLQSLAQAQLLTAPPPAGVDYPVPGAPETAAALGYLHANCGHCHNMNGTSWPDTQMVLRLRVTERDPAQSELWKTIVGQMLNKWQNPSYTLRAVSGHPEQSAVLGRMMNRTMGDAMPPLATEAVDPDGVDLITRWIRSLGP